MLSRTHYLPISTEVISYAATWERIKTMTARGQLSTLTHKTTLTKRLRTSFDHGDVCLATLNLDNDTLSRKRELLRRLIIKWRTRSKYYFSIWDFQKLDIFQWHWNFRSVTGFEPGTITVILQMILCTILTVSASRMSFIYKYETSLTPFVKPHTVLNLAEQNVFYIQSALGSCSLIGFVKSCNDKYKTSKNWPKDLYPQSE